MRLQTHALIPWLTFTAVRGTHSKLIDWRCEESRLLDGLSDFVVAWGCRVMDSHHPSEAESCKHVSYYVRLLFFISDYEYLIF